MDSNLKKPKQTKYFKYGLFERDFSIYRRHEQNLSAGKSVMQSYSDISDETGISESHIRLIIKNIKYLKTKQTNKDG